MSNYKVGTLNVEKRRDYGKGAGAKLCERNHSTEGDPSESESNIQQGERAAGEGTTGRRPVKGSLTTGRTLSEETMLTAVG